ncbi:MAG: S8 family serine peptidase [Bacteroidetes bacterium]|nr:S8 family serine peptidase [Bacteroidota bacterium]
MTNKVAIAPITVLDRNFIALTAPSIAHITKNQGDTWDVWSLDIPGNDGQNPFPLNDFPKYGINYGEELPNTGADKLSYTAHFGGTSAATPQVAGVAALMLAINPCLSNNHLKDIIENTADKIGGYDYNWLPHGISKETGHGRLNANRAVINAQESHKNTLDLYIKDCDQDFGLANSPNYNCWSVTDKSPDIWVRNTQAQPDFSGLYDLLHEDPEYSAGNPVYVYVRVRNKSCVASLGTEQLGLYWSKAATWQSWPQNWNGSDPNIGNLISLNTINIPIIQPGESTIIEVPWYMPIPLAPGLGGQLPVCVLARVEGSAADPVVLSPSGNNDVEWSNNVALLNMTAVDNINNIAFYQDGILHPIGKEILVGNANTSSAKSFDFSFETEKGNLANDARIHLITNDEGYELLSGSSTFNQEGLQGIDSTNEILITKDSIYINNVNFDAGLRIPLYVGFSFYTSSPDSNARYSYKISQSLPDSIKKLGAETFNISKCNRAYFNANAGADKSIKSGMNAILNAVPVNENAIYKWYDATNHYLGQGQNITVTPTNNSKYKLEVIATLDGFMDTDEVEVFIIDGSIISLSPNPCTSSIVVEYALSNTVQVANAVVTNLIANSSTTYSLDINSTSQTLDISNLPIGIYTLTLICNGLVTDAYSIIKQ